MDYYLWIMRNFQNMRLLLEQDEGKIERRGAKGEDLRGTMGNQGEPGALVGRVFVTGVWSAANMAVLTMDIIKCSWLN